MNDPLPPTNNDWFATINQAAMNWYAILRNQTNPNSGVTVSQRPGGTQVSISPLVLVAGVALLAVVLLKK